MMSLISFEHRLAGYALTAGAAVAAAQTAHAAIVYTDVNPDQVFTSGAGLQTYPLDLNNDGTTDFNLFFSSYASNYYGYRKAVGVGVAAANSDNEILFRSYNPKGVNSNFYIGTDISNSYRSQYPQYRPGLPPTWRSASNSSQQDWGTYGGWLGKVGVRSSSSTYGAITRETGFVGDFRKIPRMLALQFDIGPDQHYGWCRVGVDNTGERFTVYDYAYEDTPDTGILSGAYLDPILEGTVGSQIVLAAVDVPGIGNTFTTVPKVTGYYFNPYQGTTKAKTTFKGTLNQNGSAVIIDVKKKIKLCPATLQKEPYKNGHILRREIFGIQQRMFFDLEVTTEVFGITKTIKAAHLAMMPPEITGITGNIVPGSVIAIAGNWFGVKAPKVWIEYLVSEDGGIVKTVKLKVQPLLLDAKNKPSCMNVATGESLFQVQLPEAWPVGFDAAWPQHELVIDNGIGLATFPLIPAP